MRAMSLYRITQVPNGAAVVGRIGRDVFSDGLELRRVVFGQTSAMYESGFLKDGARFALDVGNAEYVELLK